VTILAALPTRLWDVVTSVPTPGTCGPIVIAKCKPVDASDGTICGLVGKLTVLRVECPRTFSLFSNPLKARALALLPRPLCPPPFGPGLVDSLHDVIGPSY
jgi:hypothetical protein